MYLLSTNNNYNENKIKLNLTNKYISIYSKIKVNI